MTIDERVGRAAAAVREGLDSVPLPDAGDVTRRVLRRRRARLGAGAVVLAAAAVAGALTVPGDGRAPERVVAGGPEEEAVPPEGSLTERGWMSVPKAAAGLDGVTAFTALSSDGPAMLLAGARQVPNGWEPAIWRSEDGTRWVPSTVPAGRGELHALAADGDTALAIGGDSEANGTSTFVWRSDDGGRTWTAVAGGDDTLGAPASEMGRPSASGLLRSKGYWVAYGGGSDGYEGIWVSRDGSEWEQVLASRSSGSVTVVEAGDGDLLAYGVGKGPSAVEVVTPTTSGCETPYCLSLVAVDKVVGWRTDDPTSWGEPEALSVPDPLYLGPVAPGAGLAIGSNLDRHDAPTPLLRSDDAGLSWTADDSFLEQFPGAWAWTVTRAAGSWIAAGASGSPNHPDAWASRDGVEWESLPASLHGTPGGTLSLVGTVADRAVLFGTAPELDRYYVYDPSYPPPVPSSATPATTTPPPKAAARPTEMVAAIEAGVSLHRVVTVDVTTGEVVRVLHDVDTGLPDAEAVAGTSSVAGVDRAPGGSSVLVDICCEPAGGNTWEVLPDGGAQRCCDLSEPAYGPDGRRVAGITMQWPVVLERGGKGGYRPVAGIDFAPRSGGASLCAAAGAAWSPDGTLLAFVTADDCATGEWVLRVLDLRTATSLADAVVFDPPAGRGYWAPAFRSDGKLLVALQTPGNEVFEFTDSGGLVLDPATGAVDASFDYGGVVRSQSYDATGAWLLVTHADGTVEWQGGGSAGTVPGTYIDADW